MPRDISRRALGARLTGLLILTGASAAMAASPVCAQNAASPTDLKAARDAPLFRTSFERGQKSIAPYLKTRPDVPAPKDAGGGYTHERHKDNYRIIREGGMLYAVTGDRAYLELVRDVLLAYADLYPKLSLHPVEAAPQKGRLFWQSLNDAVWLVEAIQGYAEVRDALPEKVRKRIDGDVFRGMCDFSMVHCAGTFERIHNHATWAVAGVGMTGYVLGEPTYVKAALQGLRGDGKTGFLRQLDELFSPDGYYTEGPYYQRYALSPFEIFAAFIDRHEPSRKIFEYRDGILIKAVYGLINLSYGGRFFPLNDAIVEKGIDSPELVQALAIVYGRNRDPQLLSVSTAQGSVAFSREGAVVAAAIAAGKSQPFVYASRLFRDGARGDEGALAVLRAGSGKRKQALVFKATAQGMGHGHFDRLSYIFYDSGSEVLTDYGAARFLNVEAKQGGRYLPENETWAKQTVCHNTLVVDGRSQFDAKVQVAQPAPTQFLGFAEKDGIQFASARLDKAWDGVTVWRAVMLYTPKGSNRPIVIDLVRARSTSAHRYDLPFHYRGVFLDSSTRFTPQSGTLKPMGRANGYQHLWEKAAADVPAGPQSLSWFLTGRFYTLHYDAPQVSKAYLTQLGANDPSDSLRPERAMILRADGQIDFNSACVLEAYGEYDSAEESARDTRTTIHNVRLFQSGHADLIRITGLDLQVTAIGIQWGDAAESRVTAEGRAWIWHGAFGIAA